MSLLVVDKCLYSTVYCDSTNCMHPHTHTSTFRCRLISFAFKILTMAHYSLETNENEAKRLKQEEEEDDGLVCGLNVIFSSMFPLAVQSAIELGIFDILAKAGEGVKLSAKDIAIEIGSKNPEAPRMLDRLLKLLSCHSMLYCSLSEDQQGLYSLAPASKCFVTDANGVSLGPFLNLILDKVSLESWSV